MLEIKHRSVQVRWAIISAMCSQVVKGEKTCVLYWPLSYKFEIVSTFKINEH